MSYESRAYDRQNDDGFPPDPVVVLVVTGTHDVSRLINLFHSGQPVIEQIAVGEQIRRQVSRHNGGRAALRLLRDHGGPDFTEPAERIKLRRFKDRDDTGTWFEMEPDRFVYAFTAEDAAEIFAEKPGSDMSYARINYRFGPLTQLIATEPASVSPTHETEAGA